MPRLTTLLLSGVVAATTVLTPVVLPSAEAAAKAPHVTKVTPAKGSVGATVTVRGTGFSHVKKVLFGTKAARFKVHSTRSLTVHAPAHARGAVDIRVVIKGHTSAKVHADRFTYVAPPPAVVVTKVSPSRGGVAGDSSVTITGRGFTGVPTVIFGRAPGRNAEVDSSTRLTVDAPAHVAGTVDIRVKDDRGTSPVASTDHYTYVAAPYSATPVTQSTGDDTEGFGAVSCGAAGSCVAGGIIGVEAEEGNPVGVLDRLAGSTWTTEDMKLPVDAGPDNPWDESGAPAVSCGAAGSCVAVDNYQTGTFVTRGVIDTLANGAWTTAAAPAPSNANSENAHVDLNGVTCLSATSCVAVGDYIDDHDSQVALVETLAGTTWTATEVSAPSNVITNTLDITNALDGISCTSATACAAYGTYADTSGDFRGWLAVRSGASWTATEAAPPDADFTLDTPNPTINAVSCFSAGGCVAAGYYINTEGGEPAFVATLASGSWTFKVAPLPAGGATGGSVFAGLTSLACPAGGGCVAVGSYQDGHGEGHGLIDTLAGSTWTARAAPLPSNPDPDDPGDSLVSVACPTTGACTAVGSYSDSDGGTSGTIATLASGSWTALEATTPSTISPDGPSLELQSLACPTQVSCVASGRFINNHGDFQGLVETHH
jgi:hypothetical protein